MGLNQFCQNHCFAGMGFYFEAREHYDNEWSWSFLNSLRHDAMLLTQTSLTSLFSSGSLPSRQVQMSDVAIPLVVELLLSAFYILPPSSNPASFVLLFLLTFFLTFSL